MSVGSKVYSAYVYKDRNAARSPKKRPCRRTSGDPGICPFTLEAIKDCMVRKKKPRTVCLFSLEDCLSGR